VYWNGPRDKGEPLLGPKFKSIPFDIAAWWIKSITINGGAVNPTSIAPMLIEMITAGRDRPSFVVDHHVRIDDAPEAYRLFSEHKVQKVVIDFTAKIGRKRKHDNGR
jgi:threonine dehydrogenase-like Zn-dependent dehydrogenase